MRVFGEIAAEVEERWAAARHDQEAFPEVVTGVLAERRPHLSVTPMDVIEWVLRAGELPPQIDVRAIFGEPPVSVYEGERLRMQVIFWRPGTTAIHRHAFTGGFAVLAGTNLHTCYRFDVRRAVSPRLQIGDVRLEKAELLRRGDVVPITRALKHNVFHLEGPSATLVVRSKDERDRPQLDYFAPSVAFDPFATDALLLRKVQVLRLLLRCDHPAHDALAEELLDRGDLETAWDVLEQSLSEIADAARAERLIAAARRRHGEAVDALVAVIEEQRRMARALRLFSAERDPSLRFFLALLHSVPHRPALLEVARLREPGADARALVMEWAERLSGVDRIGVDLSDEVNRRILEAAIDGKTGEETLRGLEGAFDPASVAAQAAEILAHRERMAKTVLAPLFRGAPEDQSSA